MHFRLLISAQRTGDAVLSSGELSDLRGLRADYETSISVHAEECLRRLTLIVEFKWRFVVFSAFDR